MISDVVANFAYHAREVLDRHWALPWVVVPSVLMAFAILSLFLLLGYSLGSTAGVVAVFLSLCAGVLLASVSIEWVARRVLTATGSE